MTHDATWTISLASHSLATLLGKARALTRAQGERHVTQRGATFSVNRVALTWLAPQSTEGEQLRWIAEDVRWYLDTFVTKHESTDPGRRPDAGSLVFPYTYAARARFWDAGWSQLLRLLEDLTQQGFSLASAARSTAYFTDMAVQLGESLHLQTVLSLLALYPPPLLAHYAAQQDVVRSQASAWRRDLLHVAIAEIGALPHSRRAVVGPLSYPHLEGQFEPPMALPPYQLFQLLPTDREAPLASIHEHRSLDIVGGAQLDFAHDLAWLNEAANYAGRAVGDITIVAHNLHEYVDQTERESADPELAATEIERWLCRVTDGYRVGSAIPAQLLTQPAYRHNAERIALRWRDSGV